MKYIKYYDERSQYTDTDFHFPFVGFQGKINDVELTDVDRISETHSLHLFTEDKFIKCEYLPSAEIKLFNPKCVDEIVFYVYNGEKVGKLHNIENSHILTFDEVPEENVVVYFLLRDANKICSNMFEQCRQLCNVSFHNKITKIGRCAFIGCINLNEIILPVNCKSVGQYAFAQCNNVTKIRFSNSLKHIGKLAFQMSSKHLKDVTFENTECFSNMSNKQGIFFKKLKDSTHCQKTFQNLILSETFSPEFFKDKTHEEKIQWANMLNGELLGNIFYDDDEFNIKRGYYNRIYSIVIPEGVKHFHSLCYYPFIQWPTEELKQRINAVSEKNEQYNYVKRVHIPDSVSTFVIPNGIYIDGGKIIFYTNKYRTRKLGITVDTIYLLSSGFLQKNTYTASVLHVSNYLYYKYFANKQFWATRRHYTRFIYLEYYNKCFECTLIPPIKHKGSSRYTYYSEYFAKGIFFSRGNDPYVPTIMPWTRTIVGGHIISEFEHIYYGAILATNNDKTYIMLLDKDKSVKTGKRSKRKLVYNVYNAKYSGHGTWHNPLSPDHHYNYPQWIPNITKTLTGNTKKERLAELDIIDTVTLERCNIHTSSRAKQWYPNTIAGTAKNQGFGGTCVVGESGNIYHVTKYRKTNHIQNVMINIDKPGSRTIKNLYYAWHWGYMC